jgi:hypothetical protein
MFSARIKHRYKTWWGAIESPGLAGQRTRFHQFKERLTYLDKSADEARWHCCEHWQRRLANKWNSRQFAEKHGCRVPDLYWSGRMVRRAPLESLPKHFVIRPIYGKARSGVYVMDGDVDLLSDASYSKDQLRARLLKSVGTVSRVPLLVEEFVTTERGEYKLPIEYKCHVFGDTVGAIQVVTRSADKRRTTIRDYTPDWDTLEEQINTHYSRSEYMDPPKCLDEIVACARRLGRAYGTYVRIDLYASAKGCVFGEFSPTPTRGEGFTPFVDEYFESLWQKHLGDKL